MSLTKLNRHFHFRVFLLAVSLLALLLITSWSRARAQSEQSPKGLEGTWRVQGTLLNCSTGLPLPVPHVPSRVSFARGGTATAIVSSPAFQPGQRTPSLGVWEAVGPQTYRFVHEAFILFDGGNFQKGVQRITEIIQVDGDNYTSAASSQFFDVNGNPIGMSGCATGVAERMH